MLAKQTAVYFLANLFSAAFGLVNTMAFTRIFAVAAFGDYLLGLAFATLYSTFLSSAIKLSVMREQARGDGTDARATLLAAILLCAPTAPLGYGVARLIGLEPLVAVAAAALGLAMVLFETSQELLRAEQKAGAFMRGVATRALLVSALGVACALLASSGAALLASSSVAFALAALSFWRTAWGGARPRFDGARLVQMAKSGAPLTFSLTLLALAGMADRFLIGQLAGAGAAGQFGASLDLVRQSLMIPAISVASAFVPMAVRLLANEGATAARAHLSGGLELLLAVVAPACVGFALVTPQLADLVLGPDFRETARFAMPILAMAVVFQIVTQQYLHTSFLLSNRNVFYVANTGSIIAFNLLASFLLIGRFGVAGAVWGRLAAEIFGFLNAYALSRFAFVLPFPPGRLARIGAATAAMATAVHGLSGEAATLAPAAGLALEVTVGVAVYAMAAWIFDLAGLRALLADSLPRLRARAQTS